MASTLCPDGTSSGLVGRSGRSAPGRRLKARDRSAEEARTQYPHLKRSAGGTGLGHGRSCGRRLEDHVGDMVSAYESATTSDRFAATVRYSFDLARGKIFP